MTARADAGDGLDAYGYNARIAALAAVHAPGRDLGRVVRADRGFVFVATAAGVVVAKPAARLIKQAEEGALPVVGDWVALAGDETDPLVDAVLPRSSAIVRRDPGRAAKAQVLAANVDVVFVTHALAGAPNLARIERELALVWDGGATPAVVLTKADLAEAPEAARAEVEGVAPGVPVHVTSAVTGIGIDELRTYLTDGRTVAFIGPSGAGKSTLVNALAGQDIRATREVRISDGRGRHATVARELVVLPGGGLVIDTPGLRAVGLWDSFEGLDQAFADIAALAAECRFRDCLHQTEPGCAVIAAVESGDLPSRRLESYRQLHAEIRHLSEQRDVRLRQEKKRADKQLARAIRRYQKDERGGS